MRRGVFFQGNLQDGLLQPSTNQVRLVAGGVVHPPPRIVSIGRIGGLYLYPTTSPPTTDAMLPLILVSSVARIPGLAM